MFEKFTERARKVMSLARQAAQNLNGESIETEHILLGILTEGGGVAAKALGQFRVDLRRVQDEVARILSPQPGRQLLGQMLGQIPFSPRSKRVIELAGEEASRTNSDVIGTEHLLIGCIEEHDGVAAQMLSHFDITAPMLRQVVQKLTEQAKPVPARPPAVAGPRRIRVVFYKKALMEIPSGRTLFVAGVAHVEVGSLVVEGVTEIDRDRTAAALAAERGSDVFLVTDA